LNVERESNRNPLILVGGTAQTIASWESHAPALSKNRPFMVYECVGQGPTPADLTDVSLPFQATQMDAVINMAFPDHEQVDLVGFSLGARICMAYSVRFPSKVRKLHVTGVAVEPSKAGSVALESWRDMLKLGNLHGFGWSILQATYSPSFLHKNVNRLSLWVRLLTENNSSEGLLAILEQTRGCDDWSVLAMSKRMTRIRGCLAVGEQDLMAPYDQALVLTGILGWADPTVIDGCGHAVPSEEPRLWRQHVLDFLDGPEE
jgi:pimeloyl-ACP methyl ester carboxylesterase